MQLFYAPDITPGHYTLSQEESHHCLQVLRMKPGDRILLTDGLGSIWEAEITGSKGKLCVAEIYGKRQTASGKRPYKLHLAVAPTKNIDRFEWMLEKATEIGVDEITPLLCEHSERKVLRNDRLDRVITAAMKQSLKAWRPVLHEMRVFGEFMQENREGQKFIAYLSESSRPLKELYLPPSDVTIVVGPEGDFGDDELQRAAAGGYVPCTLGKERLRTETAGVVAAYAVCFLNT